ncbi:pepsin-like aspartic protease [Pedomonas mirosovicensis]|uniref:pepsin-like aspartic protease n=1 Tax=Pedomonas mirosovicensis TaxID=2908641 RepID=UPI002168F6B3|nr:pepsin-like aspartic protease [Pedomonas mirosovicensis]MCH8686532.1 A1 family peptidase [Pedomonas mirosovicensis]
MSNASLALTGVIFPMQRGPFQNNGASPWYTETSLGTPPQRLKFAMDTGTNIVWSTSSLCSPTSCQHYSGGRFIWEKSSSYRFVDCIQVPFSFGPWGTMQVETGSDVMAIPGQTSLPLTFYLSADYSGSQFAQIDWDGGIGIPSGSPYAQGGTTFIVEALMNNGMISPLYPYVSFNWNRASSTGSCQIGGFDSSQYIPSEGIYMPWTPYTAFEGVEYIWSTPLDSYAVGGKVIAQNVQFCLDSGSSQFKGDNDIMNQTLQLIQQLGQPDVTLGIGGGQIVVPPALYNITIQAGPDQGKTIPQFKPLGLTNLVLVGSILMEYCYTIFTYRVVQCSPGVYSLAPVGMYAFNKVNGPKIITQPSAIPELGPREVTPGRGMPK